MSTKGTNPLPKPLRRIANNRDEKSLSASMRKKRFAFFLSLIQPLPKPIKILDVGGEERFWEVMGMVDRPEMQITLFNIQATQVNHTNLKAFQGDATELSMFNDKSFDIVFSNSVIEHLESFGNQVRMANEVQRVGQNYFIQTPNKYFPIEPHFLFPFYQFFPRYLQVTLIRHFNLGWYTKIPDKQEANNLVSEHHLLGEREMRELFPQAKIYREKVLGLTKSIVAYYVETNIH